MRGMRHFLAALLTAALLLSLAACGSTNSAGQLRLYYPAELSTKSRSTGGGDAIASVQVDWQQIGGDQLGRQQQAQYIMEQLLGACKASGFTSPEDIVRTVEVTLYFPDELGNLTAEERRLTVYEGETPSEAVVKALTERPMDIYAGLERLLPKGFTALAASVEDGTCYLNLPGSVVSLLPEDSQKQRIMLEGLVNSLCSLEGVEQVQILLNGDYQMLLGTQPVSRPLLPTE